jgi:hypothetical protein
VLVAVCLTEVTIYKLMVKRMKIANLCLVKLAVNVRLGKACKAIGGFSYTVLNIPYLLCNKPSFLTVYAYFCFTVIVVWKAPVETCCGKNRRAPVIWITALYCYGMKS